MTIWSNIVAVWLAMRILLDPISELRPDGIGEDLYPAQSIHALIDVESCGNPLAKRGRFYGLLQMYPVYLKEAGMLPYQAMTYPGAIAAFYAVQRRYRVRRKGQSDIAIAVFHKGGPGVWKKWSALVDGGMHPMDAVRKLNKKGLLGFVQRYNLAKKNMAHWCGRNRSHNENS